MNKLKNNPLFADNITSLKETSVDTHTGKNVYMTESDLEVVNFDRVKEQYTKDLGLFEVPKSNDALFLDDNNNCVFIEFKNGYMDNSKTFGVRKKIYDSILMFTDITNITISKLRETMDYVLVYNENTNKTHKEVQKKSQNMVVSSSNALDKFSKILSRHADKEYIMFGVNIFKGYCFKEVHTYSVQEFELYLKSHFM